MQRHLQTIFCDDIRHETSGKLTLVGMYSDSLFVSQWPATLPRLCLVARLISSLKAPPRSVRLRVYQGTNLIQEVMAQEADLAAMLRNVPIYESAGSSDRVQVVQFLVEFAPFQINGPCLLRVHAETEDGLHEGASLSISQTPTAGPVTFQ
jgi:hypothetical protein